MRLNPASCAVTRIQLFFHDISLGSATGFIYSFGQDFALVSSWHVFSGKHPEHGTVTHSTGCVPNRVEFHISVAVYEGDNIAISFRPMNLPLYDESGPLWLQHSGYLDENDLPHNVDIGLLPLNLFIQDLDEIKDRIQSFDAQLVVTPAQNAEDWRYQHGTARVGAEVFILGYPLGLASQGVIPIWKRGSLASEPLFNIEGNIPVIFVDALTRQGMSGSPVLFFGPEIIDESGKSMDHPRDPTDSPWLIGVYAGKRVASNDELEMALGRVWKTAYLNDIFFQRVPGGSLPHIPST